MPPECYRRLHFDQLGVNLESAGTVAGWFGVVVPAKTPRPVIDWLHREIVRILNSKVVLDRLVNEGSGVVGGIRLRSLLC